MSFVHSLIGASSLKDAFALIHVTYPAGSTCICTTGTKVLTASDTSGEFVFLIPEPKEWTVYCTDGTDSAEQQVVINTQYQVSSVELSYRLPSVYKEVEYLQGDGKAYIDTGVVPAISQNLKIVASDIGESNTIFGCRNTASASAVGYAVMRVSGTTGQFRFLKANSYITYTVTAPNTKHTYEIENFNAKIDGSQVGTIPSGSTEPDKTAFIFALHDGSSVNSVATAKIYSVQIFNSNNSLQYDFIPCYRKSDNVAGMWEIKNKIFYTNSSSTGSFVVGGDV